MPIDWENNIIVKQPHTKTRFTSVQVDEASSCHKVSLTNDFETKFFLYSSSENTLKIKKLFLLLNQLEAHVLHISSCKLIEYFQIHHVIL